MKSLRNTTAAMKLMINTKIITNNNNTNTKLYSVCSLYLFCPWFIDNNVVVVHVRAHVSTTTTSSFIPNQTADFESEKAKA